MLVKVNYTTSPASRRITPSSKMSHLKSLPICLSEPRHKLKKKKKTLSKLWGTAIGLTLLQMRCFTDYTRKIKASRPMTAKCSGIRSWAKVLQKYFYLKKPLRRTFTSPRLGLCCLIKIIIFKMTAQIHPRTPGNSFLATSKLGKRIHPSKQHLQVY